MPVLLTAVKNNPSKRASRAARARSHISGLGIELFIRHHRRVTSCLARRFRTLMRSIRTAATSYDTQCRSRVLTRLPRCGSKRMYQQRALWCAVSRAICKNQNALIFFAQLATRHGFSITLVCERAKAAGCDTPAIWSRLIAIKFFLATSKAVLWSYHALFD